MALRSASTVTSRFGEHLRGPAYGIAAAALFGVSAPLSKLLLLEARPIALAALLYLGGGIALSAWTAAKRLGGAPPQEAPLQKGDLPFLAAIVLAGGVIGPVLMLIGLERLSGVAGALLLNLEAPLTILVAVGLFGEHLGGAELAGAALVVGGAAVLAWTPLDASVSLTGALAIAAACLAWAIDNNLTQRLSLRDPVALVRWKSLGAGSAMLLVAALVGDAIPPGRVVAPALLLGAWSFGISILLDARALRLLGAAREAAYFATAPFLGAIASFPLLGEPLRWVDVAAGAVMAGGVLVMLSSRHAHLHVHPAQVHDHRHVHDEHHRHAHAPEDGEVVEPHAHPHRHEPLEHAHPHVSDLHHRHRHR
ncbi:MAG TPA: EamA family transporter [Candidatus Binatia bacterium]|nr:EamA family transporter [Candidatus Binatia bacterium]